MQVQLTAQAIAKPFVQVTAQVNTAEGYTHRFTINITWAYAGCRCVFTIEEPYLTEYAEWRELLTNNTYHLGLYSAGSGGCYSNLSKKAGSYTFSTESPGMGNDTYQEFTIPRADVEPPLAGVIEDMHARGLLE